MFDSSDINKRQFVLMKNEYNCKDFETLKLSNGLCLSYHKALKVTKIGDAVILGHAYDVEKDNLELTENIPESISTWMGRWLLITRDEIYMDACGTLGVFYGSSKEQGMIYSSSLAILHELVDDSEWISTVEMFRNKYPIVDYYPSPYTPWSNCMALMPSQKINLIDSKIVCRDDIDFSVYKGSPKDGVLDQIVKLMSHALQQISKEYKKIYLPLTAGYDSRTIFAILKYAGIDFATYTLKRAVTPEYEYKVAKLVSKKAKIKHQVFEETKLNPYEYPDKMEIIYKHCGGRTTVGTELSQYVNEIDTGKGSIILWGTLFETVFHYYE